MSGTHDRQAWERHPNIGGIAGMLLGIHDDFRSATRLVCEGVSGEGPLARERRYFERLASTLHHHHRLEEAALFPAIQRSTGTFPAELVGDHQTLTAAIDRAARALEGDDRAVAREAVLALEIVLEEHLVREETLVIPILLAMGRAEMMALLSGL